MDQKKFSKVQVIRILQDELNAREYPENEKFATDRELMNRFSVSRTTVRQVVEDLIASGYLYRIKDRGAFVNKKIMHRNAYIRSFTEMMQERGMMCTSKLISIETIIAPELARLNLGLDEGAMCYFIKRIRLADGEPLALETIYVGLDTVPGIDQFDLEKESFYDLLQNHYHKEFSYKKETISAVHVDGVVSEALYHEDSGIALRIVDVLHDMDQKVLEYSESWYHAERYHYLAISVHK